MELIYLIIFFVFGAVMGSFISCTSYRLSKKLSIIKPGSRCDNCNTALKWYDNIPIISYIILKGRCRNCKSKIPPSYLVVEIVLGILYSTSYHVFGFNLSLIAALVFITGLITVIISDIEYMIILDEVLIAMGLLLIIIYFIDFGFISTFEKIGYGCLAFLTMYGIKLLGDYMFKKESLGGGDIKLLFIFGLVLGYPMAIASIFLATFIAFPIAIYFLVTNKDNIIPFGPFLCMSAILILISGINFTDIITFLLEI